MEKLDITRSLRLFDEAENLVPGGVGGASMVRVAE
jgi:hypothetical protein